MLGSCDSSHGDFDGRAQAGRDLSLARTRCQRLGGVLYQRNHGLVIHAIGAEQRDGRGLVIVVVGRLSREPACGPLRASHTLPS